MELNPERQALSSCCVATPEKINIEWLKNHPGQLFNTELLIKERQQMLGNNAVPSCNECWDANSQGLPSRQVRFNGQEKTDTNVISSPRYISLKIGTNCNLTCSYCNRYSSTAWLNDLVKNGLYESSPKETRFELSKSDRIILKLGQKSLVSSENYKLLIDEAASYNTVDTLIINGGEPFLFNNLLDIVNKFKCQISIFTGLGVDSNRLSRILSQLPADRVTITVSAENLDKFYEFNRYGNTYSDFIKNLKIIQDSGITFNFYSVISNLTIFGFRDFLDKFHDLSGANICVSPEYLSTHIIDPESRDKILSIDYGSFTDDIYTTVSKAPTEDLRIQASKFITEFARRRNLDINIFPSSFVNWLNNSIK
jgi:sulfatase maturation enzyme AslB (radical SAM superfamily)